MRQKAGGTAEMEKQYLHIVEKVASGCIAEELEIE